MSGILRSTFRYTSGMSKMEVIDHEPQLWFLLREGEEYYQNVRCQRGFMDYSMLVRYTPEERATYQSSGHAFAATLGQNIADNPPHYEDRDYDKQLATRVTQTIVAWREVHDK
jgi:hypothetical protein